MLTDKQEKVFFYLVEYIQRYNKSPTLKEIKYNFGFKSNRNVTQYLEVLERKNLIKREYFEYRNIRLMSTDEHTVKIPILGTLDLTKSIGNHWKYKIKTV